MIFLVYHEQFSYILCLLLSEYMGTQLKKTKIKIGIVTSRGGHLFQLYRLKNWWKNYDRFWVTIPGEDVSSMLNNEKIHFAYHPESRNVVNAIKNVFLAWKILRQECPTHLISCGAGVAPPFFYIGKILGIKLIFIEPYDFIQYPSLSGKLVSPISHHMLVQHEEQLKFYKNAVYKGSTL
jgi:beta-1,4-N-acetylglucosaminyltransferase